MLSFFFPGLPIWKSLGGPPRYGYLKTYHSWLGFGRCFCIVATNPSMPPMLKTLVSLELNYSEKLNGKMRRWRRINNKWKGMRRCRNVKRNYLNEFGDHICYLIESKNEYDLTKCSSGTRNRMYVKKLTVRWYYLY